MANAALTDDRFLLVYNFNPLTGECGGYPRPGQNPCRRQGGTVGDIDDQGTGDAEAVPAGASGIVPVGARLL